MINKAIGSLKKLLNTFNNAYNNKNNYVWSNYIDNLDLELNEEDMKEFEEFAPTLLIYKGEKFAPLKMNFDKDWDLKNNYQSFQKLFSELNNYNLKDIFEKYSYVYVNKIKEVNFNNKKYTVYQYWFYWPYNSFLFDWHDNDFELIEVYVNSNKKPEYIVSSYHEFFDIKKASIKLKSMDNILFEIKHIGENEMIKDLVIHVEPGAHGQAFNPKKSVMLLFNVLKPLFKYTPTKFIPLVSSDNQDSPFYFDKNKKMIIDAKDLIDSKGFLKHRGFPYNWFVKVTPPIVRKYFYNGILGNKKE